MRLSRCSARATSTCLNAGWRRRLLAGRMPDDIEEDPTRHVSFSVSPIDGIAASPLFGNASAAQDQEVDAAEIDGETPPHEVVDHDN